MNYKVDNIQFKTSKLGSRVVNTREGNCMVPYPGMQLHHKSRVRDQPTP